MRKIWVSVPFYRHLITSRIFEYICKVNEKCIDVTDIKLQEISHEHSCEVIKYKHCDFFEEGYNFYFQKRLVCIVKQIEINTQEFPEVPKAKIPEIY